VLQLRVTVSEQCALKLPECVFDALLPALRVEVAWFFDGFERPQRKWGYEERLAVL